MPNRVKEPHAIRPQKQASGRWQARVTYYDPHTGKRREMSQTFATEREAKKWSREQEQAFRDDPNRKPPSEETLATFFQRWLDGVAAVRTRDTTTKAYGRYARPFLRVLGQKPLKFLVPADFRRVYAQMLKDGKATSTIHHTHVVAHSALQHAVNEGLIPFNPTDRVKPPRVTSPEVVPPTADEAQRLLDIADRHRLKAFWWFLAITGCRKGEAVALRWRDIDWDHKVVWIRRTAAEEGSLLTVHDTKTVKGRRSIVLSAYLLEILRRHQADQMVEQGAADANWNAEGWVFPSKHGSMLWPTNVNTLFRRIRTAAGVRADVKIHSLRHAMATAWLTADPPVPVKVVSERLGHASIAITLQIYGHLLPNMQAEAADRMDGRFKRPETAIEPTNTHSKTEKPRQIRPRRVGRVRHRTKRENTARFVTTKL